VAGVRSSSSGLPLSLLSSRDSSGVCSVVLLDCWERADRDERADFCEAGRELGVRVEPHVCSGVSIFSRKGVQTTDMCCRVLIVIEVIEVKECRC
jgi:hypothetical protein